MKSLGLTTVGIFKDKSRPTTAKTRVIAHSQHVLELTAKLKKIFLKVLGIKFLLLLKII